MSSLYCVRRMVRTLSIVMTIAGLAVVFASTLCHASDPPACSTGMLPAGDGGDLNITGGTCYVDYTNSPYKYGNVRIYNGGELCFADDPSGKDIDFWATSILVENTGKLISSPDKKCAQAGVFGQSGATLTIHLWGKDQGTQGAGGQGITCATKPDPTKNIGPCGVPADLWASNPMSTLNPSDCKLVSQVGSDPNRRLPGGVNDCFYGYMPLTYDGGNKNAYFGYKVLAVSYGGTLQLFGQKGSSADPQDPSNSGTSWARLTTTLGGTGSENKFTIDRKVDWVGGGQTGPNVGDKIVVTTTDYVASHSETLTIKTITTTANTSTITTWENIQFPHYGQTYDLGKKIDDSTIGPEQDPSVTCSGEQTRCVETRAAVALLSRSIRIVSGGNTVSSDFPSSKNCGTQGENPCYFFGGHTIFRQGFQSVQIRGVEFYQLGQGGRIMHYPVHFHMTRKTPQPAKPTDPPVTFIEDSSVWDSMTRWIVLHASQGITLARNVGYLSIGHGYYLEDSTETDNKLYSNIGILARAAVVNPQNPRQVPGILAAAYPDPTKALPQEQVAYHSDVDHPTVFWISNGWNDFQHNMAAGAGSCGACYWFVPAANSTMSRYEKWWSYASEQQWLPSKTPEDSAARAAMSPMQNFRGNSCTSAMNAFNTIGDTTACQGVVRHDPDYFPRMLPVSNSLAPDAPKPGDNPSPAADAYYPKVSGGGGRFATQCPSGEYTDCSTVTRCGGSDVDACRVTAIDHFTTSFNFTETNFAAMWLRPQWYLVSNSAITDVQLGGLTFVTGGGYSESDVVKGHWAIARNDVFIGNTQLPYDKGGSPYAENAGPFNPDTLNVDPNFSCALQNNAATNQYCLYAKAGLTMPISNFGVAQRLFSIYDGPAYEENNAYLDITQTKITDCSPSNKGGCSNSKWMYGVPFGMVQATPEKGPAYCYLPNAAIAWKQPNGFFYPPTFHSNNLLFNNVDIRHFVIEPLFKTGTYDIDQPTVEGRYCTYPQLAPDGSGLFTGYTDVDRQTELSDDDGTLTGLIKTISVNKDPFFAAPVEDIECASDIPDNMPPVCDKASETCGTARTSPYGYVTTVVYPSCGKQCPTLTEQEQKNSEDWKQWWAFSCSDPSCFGVPTHRLDVTKTEKDNGSKPFIRLSGQAVGQRSSLTVNHGRYYIDTTIPEAIQRDWSKLPGTHSRVNVFHKPYTDPETGFKFDGVYYTFLLFAKPKPASGKEPPATKQTYSMYVGKDFNPDPASGDVWAVQVDVAPVPFKYTNKGKVAWPTEWGKPTLSADGILTVTLDMSFADFKTKYQTAVNSNCKPQSFCTLKGNSCGCALNSGDPLFKQCQAVCSAWTNKDADCPDGGCYGFAVQLPADFVANNQVPPPGTTCYDSKDSFWNVDFQPLKDQNKAGTCYYSELPAKDFCTTR